MCLNFYITAGQPIKIIVKNTYFEELAMKSAKCPFCGSEMKRNGKTSSGKQRWRCKNCGSSKTHQIDNEAKQLKIFLSWLLTSKRQFDMPGQGRSFRRLASRFWRCWPLPRFVDEIHRVVYVDGIYIARNIVILIACSDSHILTWHLAKSENSHSWSALMSKIAPPEMVVTDGGSGFSKAAKQIWPNVPIQRCLFHVFCQVKRYTTARPNLQAGKELYQLAKELLYIKEIKHAEWWIERFMSWCDFWSDFLAEKSIIDGKLVYTHERLRKARRSLVALINNGTLFTFLNPNLAAEEPLPSMNNRIEGGVNSQLRELLRRHRGLNTTRRIKAVFWWCYMHTEHPEAPSEIIKNMPTDDDIELLREYFGQIIDNIEIPSEWGQGIVWSEFHHTTPYPYSID